MDIIESNKLKEVIQSYLDTNEDAFDIIEYNCDFTCSRELSDTFYKMKLITRAFLCGIEAEKKSLNLFYCSVEDNSVIYYLLAYNEDNAIERLKSWFA
jgi:hypothetical protein